MECMCHKIKAYLDFAPKYFILRGKPESKTYLKLGLTSEVGEVADIFKKLLSHNRPIDRGHLVEELGDMLWYVINQRLNDEYYTPEEILGELLSLSLSSDIHKEVAVSDIALNLMYFSENPFDRQLRSILRIGSQFAMTSLEEIMEVNMKKLESRHGK